MINIEVTDENDEKPTFQDVYTGSVLENEPPETSVMRVRAIDLDGTSPNNEVNVYHYFRSIRFSFLFLKLIVFKGVKMIRKMI